jgi:flagellar hook-basal body complex protein FliE
MTDIPSIDLHVASPRPASASEPRKGSGFGDVIQTAIQRVDQAEKSANQTVLKLLEGKATVVDTMMALQKSDISMRLTLAVRNKVIDAYREIMRMQF